MQFREQDRQIVTIINRFGWSTSELIAQWGFYSSLPAAQRRLRQLEQQGLLETERLFRNQCNAYWPTKAGADFSTSSLRAPRGGPALQDFEHDRWVQTIAVHLTDQDPTHWVTEREIWSQKHGPGRWEGRVPDGVLKSDPRTVIEYENTRKDLRKLKQIVRKQWGRSDDEVLWIGRTETLADRIRRADRGANAQRYENQTVRTLEGVMSMHAG